MTTSEEYARQTLESLKAENRAMYHFQLTKTARSRLVFKGEIFAFNENNVKDYLRRNYGENCTILTIVKLNDEQTISRLMGNSIETGGN